MQRQAGLGTPRPFINPRFDHVQIAKITNINKLDIGKVEIYFEDGVTMGGSAVPAWLLETGITITPKVGDRVLVGFIQGVKNNPVVLGFFRGRSLNGGYATLANRKLNLGTITDVEAVITSLLDRVATLESESHTH